MGKLNWGMRACAVFLLWGTAAVALPAQTFTTLHSFDGKDGSRPYAGLIQATDGNLYGTTDFGEPHGEGTVFKITPGGTLTKLHSFNYMDGSSPDGGADPGHRREFLRDNVRWRGQPGRRDLQNHP
jgi:uncharacterized repeat protein (TIGR03803 family)